MTDGTEIPARRRVLDFGQALGTLFRAYLLAPAPPWSELPGGPRGFQVMSVAAVSSCSNQARSPSGSVSTAP